jgi:hypothetical protein
MRSTDLAMRDPALAAAMGILPGGGDFGSDFGRSYEFAGEYGNKTAGFSGRNWQPQFGHESLEALTRYGNYQPEFSADFGDDYGLDAPPGAMVPHGPHGLHPQHARALRELEYLRRRTHDREMLLEPNKGSSTKVERYDFSLNTLLTIGTAATIDDMSLQPAVTLRPNKLICNVPAPGFILLTTIQVANVAITVGQGTDAWNYNPGALDSRLDAPTLSPANRATISGTYTGTAPVPFSAGDSFVFVATFQGPATIVA